MKLMFGGAFNPPTIAHIELGKYVCNYLHAESIIYMPTKQSYVLNTQKKDFAFSDEERLEMLKTIAKEETWMEVCDYEINSFEQPRTYKTLHYLKSKGIECRLLCGSDKLKELDQWKYVPEIFREFGVVAMTRSHDDIHELVKTDAYLRQFKDNLTIVPIPSAYQMISSTRIRQALAQCRENQNDTDAEQLLKTYVPKQLEGLKKYL